jgi:hypothetical protein
MQSSKTYDQLLNETTRILIKLKGTITDVTDIAWTRFNSVAELVNLLNGYITRLNQADITVFREINSEFSPTGLFQELSISNGWAQEFLSIAENYDNIYAQLTSFPVK